MINEERVTLRTLQKARRRIVRRIAKSALNKDMEALKTIVSAIEQSEKRIYDHEARVETKN